MTPRSWQHITNHLFIYSVVSIIYSLHILLARLELHMFLPSHYTPFLRRVPAPGRDGLEYLFFCLAKAIFFRFLDGVSFTRRKSEVWSQEMHD